MVTDTLTAIATTSSQLTYGGSGYFDGGGDWLDRKLGLCLLRTFFCSFSTR